jgi:asparagine N-glycosylation enzyme membrane subunit Stt3
MSLDSVNTSKSANYSKFWPLIYFVTFLLYMRNFRAVITDFGIFPRAVDSFYMARRIAYLVNHNFSSPDIDYYVNFPIGCPVHLPFGFAAINALIIKIITLGQANEGWTVAIACLTTPLFAAFIPCLAYFIGINLGQKSMGLWAAVILALLPMEYYFLGVIDHHVFETFFVALYLFFYLKASKNLDDNSALAKRNAFYAGTSIALGILFTNALPVLIGFHCFILFVQLLNKWKDEATRFSILLIQTFVFIAPLFFLLPFVVTHIADPGEINPSLGLCWLASFVFYLATLAFLWFLRDKTINLPIIPTKLLAISLSISLVGLIFLEWKSIGAFLIAGVSGFILKSDPMIAMIKEDTPLWKLPLIAIIGAYSGFVLVWPIATILVIKKGWKESIGFLALGAMVLSTSSLAILHIRFATLFVFPFCLTVGFAVEEFFNKFVVEKVSQPNKSQQIIKQLAFAVAILLMLYPYLAQISFNSTIVLPQGNNGFVNFYPSLIWLDQNTPKTSATGNEKTDYGVVVSWDHGNWLMVVGKRPVVGAPLGHMRLAREGIRDGSLIFVNPPEESIKLIEKRKVRYVVITPQNLEQTKITALPLDRNSEETAKIQNLNTENSLFTRLLNDGVPDGQAALRHFRLVHEAEAKYPNLDRPYVMIYEYVAGAEIKGQSKPNAIVKIFARLETKSKRRITYTDSIQTDNTGNFTIILPYGVGEQKYSEVKAVSPYKIQTAEKTFDFSITETDILEGKKFLLDGASK